MLEDKEKDFVGIADKILETVEKNNESVSELKESVSATNKENKEKVGEIETKLNSVEATLVKLTEKEEAAKENMYAKILDGASDRTKDLVNMWDSAGVNPMHKSIVTYDPMLGNIKSGESYTINKTTMQMNDALYFFGTAKAMKKTLEGKPTTLFNEIKDTATYKMFKIAISNNPTLAKAMSVTNNGDWVPTGFSSQLIDAIRLEMNLQGMFETFTIPAGVDDFTFPFNPDVLMASLVPESVDDDSTAIPASTLSSEKLTLSTVMHACRLLFSSQFNEDNVFPAMPFIQRAIVDSIVRAGETAIINGALTAIDADVTNAYDPRFSFNGLRQIAGGSSGTASVDISTLSVNVLRTIKANMGAAGARDQDLIWVTSQKGKSKMMAIEELKTYEKAGMMSNIQSEGVMPSFDGSPIVVSPYMRDDLNASGVYDGITTTKTVILCVNRRAFWNVDKPSGVLVETEKNINTQQFVSVATKRTGFKMMTKLRTGFTPVGIGYNLTA